MEGVLRASTVGRRIGERGKTFRSSMIELGQPCVMISGRAFAWRERTCAN
jgi:hypothetical protein